MRRTCISLLSLALLMVGCATNGSHPPTKMTGKAPPQPEIYTPPMAKTSMTFDAKCGVTDPKPIENVSAENRKEVTPPTFDGRRPPSRPEYPSYSLRAGQEGTPYIRALITETGAIERVELARTSGYVELDNAAMESFRTWRLVPGRMHEKPICMWATFPLVFKLQTAPVVPPAQ